MLEVRLPIEKSNSIELASITSEFNGILLVYVNDECIGYITYYDMIWSFHDSIDEEDCSKNLHSGSDSETHLIDLVKTLMSEFKDKLSIKAIECTLLPKQQKLIDVRFILLKPYLYILYEYDYFRLIGLQII